MSSPLETTFTLFDEPPLGAEGFSITIADMTVSHSLFLCTTHHAKFIVLFNYIQLYHRWRMFPHHNNETIQCQDLKSFCELKYK